MSIMSSSYLIRFILSAQLHTSPGTACRSANRPGSHTEKRPGAVPPCRHALPPAAHFAAAGAAAEDPAPRM